MTKAEIKVNELVNTATGIIENCFADDLNFTLKIDYMNSNLKSDMSAIVLNRIENRKRLKKSYDVYSVVLNSINKSTC